MKSAKCLFYLIIALLVNSCRHESSEDSKSECHNYYISHYFKPHYFYDSIHPLTYMLVDVSEECETFKDKRVYTFRFRDKLPGGVNLSYKIFPVDDEIFFFNDTTRNFETFFSNNFKNYFVSNSTVSESIFIPVATQSSSTDTVVKFKLKEVSPYYDYYWDFSKRNGLQKVFRTYEKMFQIKTD